MKNPFIVYQILFFITTFFPLFSACTGSSSSGRTESGSWSALSESPLTGRKDGVAVWTGSHLVVWGGDGDAGSVNTGALYDPTTDVWDPMAIGGNTPSDRTDLMDFHGMWTGDRMILWSGRSSSLEYHDDATQRVIRDDGGIYDPELDLWVPIAATAESPGRAYIQGVWTGEKMIVWGGHNETSLGTASVEAPSIGAIYDPGADLDDSSDDVWQAISTVNAPSQRRHSVVVWTGTRLVIWGGSFEHEIFYDDFFFYNPETDEWTEISRANNPSENVPSPRELAAYVWTGSKLIVWGGFNGEESLNNGAVYDPTTNTWTAMASSNAPTARATTSVVWTGTEMIVWGGVNQSVDNADNVQNVYRNTGATYNPETNVWTPMAQASALSARRGFYQVWTGSQLIIWGGYDGENYLDDGALFTP